MGLWLALPAQPVAAQDSGTADLIVNQDILYNLDWAAAVSAQARAQRGATALQAPAEAALKSRVLVEPRRMVALAPPPRKPVPPSTPVPQAAAAAEPAAAPLAKPEDGSEAPDIEVAAESAQDSAPGALRAPPVVPPPPEPLQIEPPLPEPPLPEPAAADLVLTPSAPPPEPALPQTVAALETPDPVRPEPPAPEPAAESAGPSEPPPTPQPGTTQTAHRPPPPITAGEYRLLFAEGSTDLSDSAKETLTKLTERLSGQPDRRIQLRAFALGSESNASLARRLSHSRALAVRGFLIEKGVSSRRIDIRALGETAPGGPPDRVDVLDARS